LKKHDTGRVKLEKPRGILHVRAEEAKKGVSRYWPAPDLAPFIEHFWIVRWDLSEARTAETVPHPSVHMAFETSGRAEIIGVMDRKFSRVIQGRGRVVGTKFRPGGFRTFLDRSVAGITNKTPRVEEVFGKSARHLGRDVIAIDDDLEGIAVIESFLRGRKPKADETLTLVQAIAARIAGDRSLTRVEQIVSEFRTNLRALQRIFKDYAGVSPKWIIQRYRLLEAAERMAEGTKVAWADLALDLGYADQAHFIRHFKRFVGRTPADYTKSLRV
jgi:AraC-like DNA-binding protein